MELEVKKTYHENGNIECIEYITDGIKYHKDIPAEYWYYENGQLEEVYYYNKEGKWHREDGPTIMFYNRKGDLTYKKYYLNGEEITDEFKIMIIDGLKTKNNSNVSNNLNISNILNISNDQNVKIGKNRKIIILD